ncbi:hypothetical protein VFPBJ_09956 [Purpureocillium lilacinum]|uniref:Uncharacterized protein n=1 Tax=Purpureocillium lilacinum TaxID=33203 RepID=A0A179GB87_PURLI|nr:hypothetical protein VFPBJ_09956 [Purpureocillium lilacinum]
MHVPACARRYCALQPLQRNPPSSRVYDRVGIMCMYAARAGCRGWGGSGRCGTVRSCVGAVDDGDGEGDDDGGQRWCGQLMEDWVDGLMDG